MPLASLDLPLDHLHHLVHRDVDGDHDPDDLVGLGVHTHGWTTRLDDTTGAFTITRQGATWTSVPGTTPLSRA